MAVAGLWRGLKLERQKLLCELVIVHCEEQSPSEMPASEKGAAVP
jgi:hypothetical protein